MRHELSMRALLMVMVVLSSACRCGPTIEEPVLGEVRLVAEVDGVLVESDALSLIASPGQSVAGRFGIINVGRNNLVVESLTAAGPLVQVGPTRLPGMVFELASVEGVDVQPGDSVMVPVTFHAGPVGGTTQAALLDLRFSRVLPGMESLPFTLVGRTFRTDCATITKGAALELGRVAVGESVSDVVVLRNDTSEVRTLNVSAVGNASNAITLGSAVSVVLQPNTSQSLDVHFAPTDAREEDLAFLLNSPDGCADQLVRIRGKSVSPGLTFEPSPVDFGAIEPPGTVERTVTVRNHTSQAATLSDLAVTDSFSLVTPGPFIVPAGTSATDGRWSDGVLTLTLRFSPLTLGPSTGQLSGRTSFVAQSNFTVPLRGLGGSRRLCIDSPVEFGKVPYFAGSSSVATRSLRLRSCGSLPVTLTLPFIISTVNLETSAGELCVGELDRSTNTCTNRLPPEALTSLQPGALLELPVHVLLANSRAATNGLKEWDVAFGSDDTSVATTTVRVTAQPVTVPPCSFAVTPSVVKFATLSPGTSAVSVNPVQVCNVAPLTATGSICLVHSFQVSGAGFSAPSMPPGVVELAPQQCVSFDVHANATLPEGVKRGAIELSVSEPIRPRVSVPLSMEVGSTCLAIAPLDFGTVAPGCRTSTRNLGIVNRCSQPVAVTSSFLASGFVSPGVGSCTGSTACPLFAPSSPVGASIPPGLTQLRFDFPNLGPAGVSVGWFRIETLEPQQRSYLVRLSGSGAVMAETTDTFGPPPAKADVLLVVDGTQSYQSAFAQNVSAFLSSATSRGVDWQAGVTIAEDDSLPDGGCTSAACTTGELLPIPGTQGRLVSSTQTGAAQQLAATVQAVGSRGSAIEKCLQPAIAAMKAPFLRDDASVGVVCMTKASEQSSLSIGHATVLLESLTGDLRTGRLSWNVITPVDPAPMGCLADPDPRSQTPHALAASTFHGLNVDACSIDWPSALTSVGARAFGLRDTFFLRGTPMSSSGMTVKQNGVSLPATAWRYDAASNAVVVTDPAYLPVAGAGLDISYPLTCL